MKKQEKQDKEEKQKELMEKLEEGIKAVFTSERYTEYLNWKPNALASVLNFIP